MLTPESGSTTPTRAWEAVRGALGRTNIRNARQHVGSKGVVTGAGYGGAKTCASPTCNVE